MGFKILLFFASLTVGLGYLNCSGGFESQSNQTTDLGSTLAIQNHEFEVYSAQAINNFPAQVTSMGIAPSLPLKRENVIHHVLGTSHAKPRYNPHGSVQKAFIDGAIDAYNMGFQTFKIWNGPEVRQDASFYFLSDAERARMTDFSAALDLEIYKAVLAIPFKTVVFDADDEIFWNMTAARMKPEDKDRIYRTTYDFAAKLRRQYRGSGRTFIIQNHEGDWHLMSTPGSSKPEDDPTPLALENMYDYLSTRQAAIEKARQDVPSDAEVFHLCEVVRVVPSMERGAPSVTQNILPRVACDLVGYSAYDSASVSDNPQLFERALAYLKSKALPSATHGSNNVVVSEIGLPEQMPNSTEAHKNNIANIVISLISRGMPYVLFWNLYDNECIETYTPCKTPGAVTSNVAIENLQGYYVRKPDGRMGEIILKLLPTLQKTSAVLLPTSGTNPSPQPVPAGPGSDRSSQIRDCYKNYLGREPDAQGLNYWMSAPGDFLALCQQFIASSAEAQIRQCYLRNLGREPDAEGMFYWLSVHQKGATIEQICNDIK